MRVYKQPNTSNLKIHLHSGDICRLRAKECLREIALQCEDLQSNWYNEAHEFAVSLSKLFNIDLEIVCKVIAALSPMQRCETNKRQAYKCLLAKMIADYQTRRFSEWKLTNYEEGCR